MATVQRIYIVPVEPPPLSAPGHVAFSVVGWSKKLGPTFAPDESRSHPDQRVANLIKASIEEGDSWLPTRVLAVEAKKQLAARGIRSEISPEIKRITEVKNRDATVFMENWLKPLRNWYNSSEPVLDYRGRLLEPSTYVVEIGILNYELAGTRLLLQVMVKAIDASTGRLVGRSRAFATVPMPDFDKAFAGDGATFKAIFESTGQDLVKQCLAELGFAS